MNFKPAFILPGEDKPCTNAQVFATYNEAFDSAHARYQVWTMPTDFCVIETEDPVNYKIVDGREMMIEQAEQYIEAKRQYAQDHT